MKAFIFVTLVACVAARGLDLQTLRLIKEKSLLNRPVVDDLLLKEQLGQRLPLEKTIVGDVDRVVPVERELVQGQDLFRGIRDVDQVLTIDELYTTELFREYLTIPLFRQYIQYPVFQRYIASVYFQRFWQLPTFRQYFINPVLFYKYVYPLVTLFQNEYTLPLNQETIRGQDLVYGQDTLERQTLENLILKNRNVLPYVYGQQDVYNRIPTVSGQYYPWTTKTTEGINQQWLLNKIIRNLLVKPVEEVRVKTDVVLPVEKKVVVEPITGERQVIVEQPKVVEVKVDEKIVPVEKVVPEIQQVLPYERPVVDTVLDRDQIVREALLKDLVKEKYLTPEVYHQYQRYQQVRDIPTISREGRQIYDILNAPLVTRREQDIYNTPYVTRREQDIYNTVNTPFVTRREQDIFTPYVNRLVQGERANLINKIQNLYNTEIPTIRENTVYDRLPLQQVLGNIVA